MKVWELLSGLLLCSLEGHTGSVTAVTVTGAPGALDGQQVVSGPDDNTLKQMRHLKMSGESSLLRQVQVPLNTCQRVR